MYCGFIDHVLNDIYFFRHSKLRIYSENVASILWKLMETQLRLDVDVTTKNSVGITLIISVILDSSPIKTGRHSVRRKELSRQEWRGMPKTKGR